MDDADVQHAIKAIEQTAPASPASIPDASQRPSTDTVASIISADERLRVAVSRADLSAMDAVAATLARAVDRRPQLRDIVALVATMADVLRQRYEFSRDSHDLAMCVALLDAATPHLDPEHFLDRDLVNAAAAALTDSYFTTGIDRLAESLHLGEALLAAGSDDPSWWRYHNTHANTLATKYQRDGTIADLEAAVGLLASAVEGCPVTEPARLAVLYNFADNSMGLHRIDPSLASLRKARAAAVEAYELVGARDLYVRPRLERLLAESLLARGTGEGPLRGPLLALAGRLASSALGSAQKTGLELDRCRVTFANALLGKFHESGEVDLLDRCAAQYDAALREIDAESPNRTPYAAARATTLRRKAEVTGDAVDVDAAVAAFRSIWATRPAHSEATDVLFVSREWAEWALRRHAYDEAAEAARHGLDQLRVTFGRQQVRRHKEAWLGAARTIPLLLGCALARAGKADEAALSIEAGRAVLIAETLSERGGDHDDAASNRAVRHALDPDWQTISEASRVAPICYLIDAQIGGAAVVVVDGTARVVTLDRLTTTALEMTANDFSAATLDFSTDVQRARDAMSTCCAWLAETLAPARLAFARLGLDEIALIPGGRLAELPLHAAAAGDAPWIQELTITYVPSAAVLLRSATARNAFPSPSSVLIVDEPLPVDLGPLRHSSTEARAVQSQARAGDLRATVLRHGNATVDALVAKLPGCDCLHFSGHAVAEPHAPMTSWLAAADRKRLPVEQLRTLAIEPSGVVVLSACESGVSGRALPEEGIGLPGALLEAGAAAVIASMWPVQDTTINVYLMAEFYRRWFVDREAPHRALTAAIRWLRTAGRDDMVRRHPSVEPDLAADPAALRLLSRWPVPIEQWAAFAFTGR